MHNMLKTIIENKRKALKKNINNKFKNAILQADGIAFIGELKFASPVDGHIGSVNMLAAKVKQYEKAKLNAISIITERDFFKGDVSFIPTVKQQTSLPILQKDFIIDDSQIYDARTLRSDALLLIARIVDTETLKRFVVLTRKLNIEPVVEIANNDDLTKALQTETDVIAVNARNLDTFTIDVHYACNLIRKIPSEYIRLGFSGIKSSKEVLLYKNAGVKGVLIGTSLMRAGDIGNFIKGVRI